MRLIRNQGSQFSAGLDGKDWHPVLQLPIEELGRDYYRRVHAKDFHEYTFAIDDDGKIVGVVECDNARQSLARFGFPIEPWIDPDLSYHKRRQVVTDICSELRRIRNEAGLQSIKLRSTQADDPDGLLLAHLLQRNAALKIEVRAAIDLTLSEELLFEDLRKGHRQQVRWGNENLVQSFVDSENQDRAAFDAYRNFHAEVAGRVTRPIESWDAMYKMIVCGRGDLVLGHYAGDLVAGTMVMDGGDTAYYASAVYDRKQFDKPLGHAPLFNAIIRAKRRGLEVFDVGEIPLDADEKEMSIGYFKQGFTSRRQVSHCLSWAPE